MKKDGNMQKKEEYSKVWNSGTGGNKRIGGKISQKL